MDKSNDLTAHVHRDIIDLLSAFLPNRRAEVGQIRNALAAGDWLRLRHIAERMYALGNPYGFAQITIIGRLLREACSARDRVAVNALIEKYDMYLSRVTIVEVDVPRQVLTSSPREAFLAMMYKTPRSEWEKSPDQHSSAG
jgi:hypothetical protein